MKMKQNGKPMTAICMVLALAGGTATAQDAVNETQNETVVETQEIVTQEQVTDSKAANMQYAAERILIGAANARIALSRENNEIAGRHVDDALATARQLQASAPALTTRTQVRSGRVVYTSEETEYSYYVPVGDGIFTAREYDSGPFWADEEEGVAVEDAELVYVDITLNSKTAVDKLTQASEAMSAGKFDQADDLLAELQDDSIKEGKITELPLQKAQDNMFLARQLLEDNLFSGAKFALRHAEDALDEAEDQEELQAYVPRIREMRSEVKNLRERIDRREVTAMEEAGAKVKEWWNELKTWTKETL